MREILVPECRDDSGTASLQEGREVNAQQGHQSGSGQPERVRVRLCRGHEDFQEIQHAPAPGLPPVVQALEPPLPGPLPRPERHLGRPEERTHPRHDGCWREVVSLPEQIVINSVRDRAGEQEDIRHHLGALPPVEVIQFDQVLAEV